MQRHNLCPQLASTFCFFSSAAHLAVERLSSLGISLPQSAKNRLKPSATTWRTGVQLGICGT